MVVLGYGVYPEHEGYGYATEAATLLCRARLADDRVKAVRATIPIGHTTSEKVATGAGLSATDRGSREGRRQAAVLAVDQGSEPPPAVESSR